MNVGVGHKRAEWIVKRPQILSQSNSESTQTNSEASEIYPLFARTFRNCSAVRGSQNVAFSEAEQTFSEAISEPSRLLLFVSPRLAGNDESVTHKRALMSNGQSPTSSTPPDGKLDASQMNIEPINVSGLKSYNVQARPTTICKPAR